VAVSFTIGREVINKSFHYSCVEYTQAIVSNTPVYVSGES